MNEEDIERLIASMVAALKHGVDQQKDVIESTKGALDVIDAMELSMDDKDICGNACIEAVSLVVAELTDKGFCDEFQKHLTRQLKNSYPSESLGACGP